MDIPFILEPFIMVKLIFFSSHIRFELFVLFTLLREVPMFACPREWLAAIIVCACGDEDNVFVAETRLQGVLVVEKRVVVIATFLV